MSIINLSEEEKKKILEKHKNAIKSDKNKKEEEKKGLKAPKQKKN